MIVVIPSFDSSCDALDKVYSMASQRSIDTLAIKQIGDNDFELMRRTGKAAWTAAIRGVCLHAETGDQAAKIIGQRGLLASDLVDYLPQLLHR
ncbi:MAG: hypothetical protein SVC26_05050 [Pseudomonadota bacterium]|nr:hypothetical protein [Pseudomonadota bacterium]